MMKQRWGLDRNVLRPTPGDPRGAEQHHWNTGAKENQQMKLILTIKDNQARERKTIKCTKHNIQHMFMRSPILAVTLHEVREIVVPLLQGDFHERIFQHKTTQNSNIISLTVKT